jgi:phthiocerol/phenolphthiocerol synthesis type-I polyketide synthase D
MKFGLMFFASSEAALSGDKYRLVIECARFADANAFSSVWVPERHFTEFGSLYPNPAVLHSALAMCTTRVKLMAGSVVAPLHSPIRITEEWSMVDNLSGGRVGISFAPGWNPDDFALNPGGYAKRQQTLHEAIQTIQHLWQGGTLEVENGLGEMRHVRVYPTPVQPSLPVWLTAAGNPQTFRRAGEVGANVLTHVLDQDEDQLAQKIKLYREAREAKGFDPAAGQVTVMLHTFVGNDAALVREQAREPYCNYLRNNIHLLNGLAQSRGQQVDVRSMPAKQLDDFINYLYERFAQSRGLIGTPESSQALIHKLAAMGVDEVACLLDFGPPTELILENLPHLQRLQAMCQKEVVQPEPSLDLTEVQSRCSERVAVGIGQGLLRKLGISDRTDCVSIWRGSGEALARIVFPDGAIYSSLLDTRRALVDVCEDVFAMALGWENKQWLPGGFNAFRPRRESAGSEFWIHAVASASFDPSSSPSIVAGNVRAFHSDGQLMFELESMRLQTKKEEISEPDADQSQALSELVYRRDWKLLEGQAGALPAGAWLVVTDQAGLGARLAEELEAAGANCSLCFDAPASGNFSQRLKGRQPLEGVLYLRSLDLAPMYISGRKQVSTDLLEMVKGIASNEGTTPPRLWIVTSGAMSVFANEKPAIAQTPVWGLGQAIAAEHPEMWGGLLDLDPQLAEPRGKDIWEAIAAANGEDLLAIREQELYAQRIVRDNQGLASDLQTQLLPLQLDGNATYLVTGRLNGLGLHLADRLRKRGARHIVLIGRSKPVPESRHDRFIQCDLSGLEDTTAAIREIERSMPPLKGVFHLAGTLDDGLLLHQNAERFYASGTGKAEGALNLHFATQAVALDYFVLYSTIATLVTVPGQASYAAANIVLDALAHLRRAEGKPSLCINWGPWSELGMTATDYGRAANARLASAGIGPLDPEIALDMLERLMIAGVTQSAVARIDWSRLFANDPRSAASPLLSEFGEATGTLVDEETELIAQLRACPHVDRTDLLRTVIASMIAESLRLPDANAISPAQSFLDLGFDSILALELTNRLSTMLGRSLPGTLFFTSPTLESLVDHLLEEMAPLLASRQPVADSETLPLKTSAAEPLEQELTEGELSRLIAQEISGK